MSYRTGDAWDRAGSRQQAILNPIRVHMPRAKYILIILAVLIIPRCTTVEPNPPAPTINPRELLLSHEDMPIGWRNYSVFSDEYDDWCYIDCAILQFSPVDRDGVYAEQTIYVYYTVEEAARNYEELLPLPLSETISSGWSYESDVASRYDLMCYKYRDVSFPSCIWLAQYGKYVVEFYAELVPERMSLDDLEKVIQRIDAKMKVVAKETQ